MRRDRREWDQSGTDLAAEEHQPVPARQHPIHVTARMCEPMAAEKSPPALEELVSRALAGWADENRLRQSRVRAEHYGLVIDPDFSGLVCGELAPPVRRLDGR